MFSYCLRSCKLMQDERFATASSLQHAVDKFRTPYICIEAPGLLPSIEHGWMGVTTQYSSISVHTKSIYLYGSFYIEHGYYCGNESLYSWGCCIQLAVILPSLRYCTLYALRALRSQSQCVIRRSGLLPRVLLTSLHYCYISPVYTTQSGFTVIRIKLCLHSV